MAREAGLKADYGGAAPGDVARALATHRPRPSLEGLDPERTGQPEDGQEAPASLREVIADACEIGRRTLSGEDQG